MEAARLSRLQTGPPLTFLSKELVMIDELETAIHNFVIALYEQYSKQSDSLEAKCQLAKFLDDEISEFADANPLESSYINTARKTTALMDVEKLIEHIDELIKTNDVSPESLRGIRHDLIDMKLKLRRE